MKGLLMLMFTSAMFIWASISCPKEEFGLLVSLIIYATFFSLVTVIVAKMKYQGNLP